MRKMREELYLLHVLSALHVGGDDSGDGFIDQPVAREAASAFPLVPGSALKGVLRDESAFWEGLGDRHRKDLFGTGGDDDGGAQGTLIVGDARVLCLPVRSLAGVFAWVTCPLVLGRFLREARWFGAAEREPCLPSSLPTLTESRQVLLSRGSVLTVGDGRLYLGPLKAHPLKGCLINQEIGNWADVIAKRIYWLEAERETDLDAWTQTFITPFVDRFAIASNTVFAYLCQTALELRPRIRIDDDTGVANNLWYIEALPPETVLWGGLRLNRADEFETFLPHRLRLQIGGSATAGFGQCLWLRPQAAPKSEVTP